MNWDPESILKDFQIVAGLAGVALSDGDILFELHPAPHARRRRRPQRRQCVLYVSKIESGERRLDVVELLELAKILGADPVQIVRVPQKVVDG